MVINTGQQVPPSLVSVAVDCSRCLLVELGVIRSTHKVLFA